VKKAITCCMCESELDKNTVGLNKKLLDKKPKKYFCMNCLSAHLSISIEDLFSKIEDLKLHGCTLFD
jgi:uncharacterized protein (DUF1810 family)